MYRPRRLTRSPLVDTQRMLSGQEFPIDDWTTRDVEFAGVTDRAFSQKVFNTHSSLRRNLPDGLREWKQYNGEPFDESVWELIPGGWDHEHCSLCWARIADGMTYWANGGEFKLLCDYCHDHYASQLTAPPTNT